MSHEPIRCIVVRSTIDWTRLSLRTADHESVKTALVEAGYQAGDHVLISLAPPPPAKRNKR